MDWKRPRIRNSLRSNEITILVTRKLAPRAQAAYQRRLSIMSMIVSAQPLERKYLRPTKVHRLAGSVLDRFVAFVFIASDGYYGSDGHIVRDKMAVTGILSTSK